MIDRSEVLRYLGYGTAMPDPEMTALLSDCEQEILTAATPKFRWNAFERDGRQIIGTSLALQGDDIVAHLSGCSRVVLLAATLGAEVDRRIQCVQVSDLTRALVLDATANALIEQVCDTAEREIRGKFPDWYTTWRFSPGYGDFPLTMQRELLAVLDAPRRMGLCASENHLLTPRKSVTALLGLSAEPIEQKQRGCANCNLREDCTYRKRGERCDV